MSRVYQDVGVSEGDFWVSIKKKKKDKKKGSERAAALFSLVQLCLLIFPGRQVAERETSDFKWLFREQQVKQKVCY